MPNLEKFAAALSVGEAAVIFSEVSRRYLSGFPSSDGVLFVTSSEAVLYLDPRYEEAGRIAKKNGSVPENVVIKPYVFAKDFAERKEIKTVFFEDRRLTVSELASLERRFPDREWKPLGDAVDKLRKIKTASEIEKIAQSQCLAEAAFSDILGFLSVNRTEIEVASRLEWFMKKNGASAPSFETICVSGQKSSMPHGVPEARYLENNAFVTLDFGCVLDGYCSDMTRTVCIGKADRKMKKVYETVLLAQKSAMAKVKDGVSGSEVDAGARDVIKDAGFGEFFGHSTGHGVGLEVHESPSFSPGYKDAIPEGAVLSVEPGIYLPGEFGVRIENLVAVTKDGFRDLNSSERELIEL